MRDADARDRDVDRGRSRAARRSGARPRASVHRVRSPDAAQYRSARRPGWSAMALLRLRDILGGPLRGGATRRGRGYGASCLPAESVDYRLVRARRRSIGMQIGLSGLTVRAPRWVTIREIEETLTERAAWILRSLAEWRARRRDVLPREWKTGAPILFLGRELALAVHTGAGAREIAADLLNLTVLHPAPGRRAAGRRVRRPMAARGSAAHADPARDRIRGARSRRRSPS